MVAERTLPGGWYGDEAVHRALIERVFVPSWQAGPGLEQLGEPGAVVPWTLAPGTLDEPVVTTRREAGLRTLSNACTHRGAKIVDHACHAHTLRCPYHGRRFDLGGRLQAAPGFATLPEGQDLPQVRTSTLGPLVVATLGDGPELAAQAGDAWARVAPVLDREMTVGSARSYEIDVNWMLYVENYLEGMHVPFVHPGLARAIDLRAYHVEVLPGAVLQVAEATDGATIPLSHGHPDADRAVAAYYLWFFPDLMVNLYPWGLSLNHVQPLGPRRTRVVYRTWVADPSRLGAGAGGDLDTVELEDQDVVRRVQAAVGSRLYRPGTYAPGQEDGVRAFHRWIRAVAG